MAGMSLLVIIPARGGSKGIPRKNIKPLAGRPLIGWSIDTAKQASCVDRTIVSTEDEEIASVARELGADVPFMRPAELAADDAPGMAPVLHAISQLTDFDWVLLLQPTSPLRSAEDIDGIWQFCQERGSPSAVSVCEVGKHPYLMYQCNAAQRLEPFIKGRPDLTRRQDLPPAYVLNGALYLARTEWLLERKDFIGPETLGYIMPPERSVDLDTQQDWRWVEFLIEQADV
ncbi:acylneuraminate cytidylyltransferase family protein [Alphaproteobacteria bacterium]|nr:acylneuraminate cytidylyltransferase family protein [Alphaproteobacteria bacterium]